MNAEQIEQEYLEFCARVKQDAMRLMAMATNKRDPDTIADAALALADVANAQQHQYRMRQEQRAPAAYDLAALRVDAGQASNSETGYEDRG
jgi:hypothetical protein